VFFIFIRVNDDDVDDTRHSSLIMSSNLSVRYLPYDLTSF